MDQRDVNVRLRAVRLRSSPSLRGPAAAAPGVIVTYEGDGGARTAAFLAERKFI
jgi:hypothetical protein